MYSAWDAMNALGGIIGKPRIILRSTKKVINPLCGVGTIKSTRFSLTGKYLLEREKLVKDNAWKLDE